MEVSFVCPDSLHPWSTYQTNTVTQAPLTTVVRFQFVLNIMKSLWTVVGGGKLIICLLFWVFLISTDRVSCTISRICKGRVVRIILWGSYLHIPYLCSSVSLTLTRLEASSFKPRKDQKKAINRWNKFILGPEYIRKAAELCPRSKEHVNSYIARIHHSHYLPGKRSTGRPISIFLLQSMRPNMQMLSVQSIQKLRGQ